MARDRLWVMRWLWVVTVSSVVMVLVGCAETNAPTGTLPPPSITITPDYEAKVDVDVQATGQAIMASTVPPTPTPTPPPSPPTSTPGTVPITPTVFATLTPSPTILYEPTPRRLLPHYRPLYRRESLRQPRPKSLFFLHPRLSQPPHDLRLL